MRGLLLAFAILALASPAQAAGRWGRSACDGGGCPTQVSPAPRQRAAQPQRSVLVTKAACCVADCPCGCAEGLPCNCGQAAKAHRVSMPAKPQRGGWYPGKVLFGR